MYNLIMEVWTTVALFFFVLNSRVWSLLSGRGGWLHPGSLLVYSGSLIGTISYFYVLFLYFEERVWWSEIFWAIYFFSLNASPPFWGYGRGSREDHLKFGLLLTAFICTIILGWRTALSIPWILWHALLCARD